MIDFFFHYFLNKDEDSLRVYIANFGEENYEWPVCKAKGTVATMNDIKAQPLWEQGKKEEYIVSRMKNDKSARGQAPTRQTASRWYNLMTIISETADDLWIHRDGEKLYWTISKNASQRPQKSPSQHPP